MKHLIDITDLNVEEIRIRNNKPIILKASTQEKTIRYFMLKTNLIFQV